MDAQGHSAQRRGGAARLTFVTVVTLALLAIAPGLASAGPQRASGTAQVSFEGVIVGSIKVEVSGRYETGTGSIQFSGIGPRGGESWRADITYADYWYDAGWHVAYVTGCIRSILEPACRFFSAQLVDGREFGPGHDEFSMGFDTEDPGGHTWYWVEKGNLVVWD